VKGRKKGTGKKVGKKKVLSGNPLRMFALEHPYGAKT
jgi:hypothetical protein